MSSFSKSVDSWAKKTDADIDAVLRKVFFDASSSIIMLTPVDTGRARANWIPAKGSPSVFTTEDEDKGAVSQKGAGKSATKDAVLSFLTGQNKIGDTSLFLTNSVPYIGMLEFGSSDQAPNGMVRLTVSRFLGITQEAIRLVRRT